MHLTVMPAPNTVPAAHHPDDIGTVPFHLSTDLKTALYTRYDHDAHAVQYTIPGADRIPRLGTGILAHVGPEDTPVVDTILFDVDNPDHTPHPDPPPLAPAFDLPPWVGWYRTRAGWRLIVILSRPVPVTQWRGLRECVLSDLGPVPGLDNATADWTRLFRLPYVVRDGVPTSDGRIHLPPFPWTVPDNLPTDTTPSASSSHTPGNNPPPPVPEAPPSWVWDALSTLPNVDDLRAGAVLAHPGNRHEVTLATVGSVMRTLPLPPEARAEGTYSVVYPAYRAMCDAYPDSDPGKLWDVCCYVAAQVDAGTDAAQVVRDAVQVHKERAREARDAVPGGPTRAILYTRDGRWAYVWDPALGSYRPPVSLSLLCKTVETYASALGLSTRGKKGAPRLPHDILHDYGTEVSREVRSYTATAAHLSPDGVLTLPGARVDPALVPTFSAEVDAYLSAAFSPTDLPHVLDWLASATRLDSPTCALYLEGDPGAGKSLFALALARVWGTTPIDYADATGRFNGALAHSPVILADEPPPGLGDHSSTVVRRLLSGAPIRLEAKFQPTTHLHGCPRLIIAANNGEALHLRESLNAADIAALQERIGHVRIQPAAVEYFRSIGGRAHVHAHWIEGAAFARHVLWLRDNHTITQPGSRYLVAGWPSTLLGNLAGRVDVNQALCLVIARRVLSQAASAPGIYAKDGVLYAHLGSLHRLWTQYGTSSAPRETTIRTALQAISDPTLPPYRPTTDGRPRCTPIQTHLVASVAVEYDITPSPEDFSHAIVRLGS